MSFNLTTMLRETAMRHPDKPAFTGDAGTLTYAQLKDASDRIAAGLYEAGLERGDRVAIQLPNLVEFVVLYFGVLTAGMIAVPVNPLFTASELDHILRDSGARLIVTHPISIAAARPAADHLGVRLVAVADIGTITAERPIHEAVTTNADDAAVLIYTSGTTGRPKGAELTHFQLFQNATTAGEFFEIRIDDVSLAALPLFHIYGLSSLVNVSVRYGVTVVLVPRFEPAAVLDVMSRYRVTVFSGVPTMFYALLAEPSEADLSALRVACSGGASLPETVLRGFEKRFGVVILEGYGMSETASTATFNASEAERRILSVGKPVWGVEAKIVAPDGSELPTGPEHVGELLLRGHIIMKGYFNNQEATAEALRDGWLHTGDLVYRDADGFIFIIDRIKDLVIRGGYNVYPREVEEVLYTHPAVGEAVVIGRPDERLGEEVVAVVSLKAGETATPDELIAHCRVHLAAYKYPREVRILDALPKTATGKLLKRELR